MPRDEKWLPRCRLSSGANFSPAFGDTKKVSSQQGLGSRRSQANDVARGRIRSSSGIEPGTTRGDLTPHSAWRASGVLPRLPLEMLDDVCEEDLPPTDSGCVQLLVRIAPAGPTKGCPALSSWWPGASTTKNVAHMAGPSPRLFESPCDDPPASSLFSPGGAEPTDRRSGKYAEADRETGFDARVGSVTFALSLGMANISVRYGLCTACASTCHPLDERAPLILVESTWENRNNLASIMARAAP